jgi:hypothetical protein
MTLSFVIRCVGISHALQPPLTWLLARRLGLAKAFSDLPPTAAEVARNMGFASVFLPTTLGLLVGAFADEVVDGSGLRALAWLLCVFWTWRLLRQRVVGRYMPTAWHLVLTAIFLVQGPVFAFLLLSVARGAR